MNNYKQFLTYLSIKKYSFTEFHECICQSPKPQSSIGFLAKGSAEFIFGDERVELNEGEIIYIPKGATYFSRWYGSPKIKHYTVFFDFSPDFPEEENKIFKFKLQALKPTEKSDKKMFKKFFNAYGENFFRAAEIFYSIYGDIADRLEFDEEPKRKNPVIGAVKFIEENCGADFDVKHLATLSNLSESRFYELFKKHTGFTPTEYKNNQRIQRAAMMLRDENNTVEAISDKLNFSSPAYFRRVFKAFTGKTPKEYRNHAFEI